MKKLLYRLEFFSAFFIGVLLSSCDFCDSRNIHYEYELNNERFGEVSNGKRRILEIHFHEGFHNTPVEVEIENTKKKFNRSYNPVLGITGFLKFKKTASNSIITLRIKNSNYKIMYDSEYDFIHFEKDGCNLKVLQTNRKIVYE